ncbi:unnamed protein product, partial [Polarella glacialis]
MPSSGRSTRALLLTAAFCVLASACCSRAFASTAIQATAATGRRAAVLLAGGWMATAGQMSSAFAKEEISADQEACLSECVYKCAGGAQGKGGAYQNRKDCINICKDKCLPKAVEEDMVLS